MGVMSKVGPLVDYASWSTIEEWIINGESFQPSSLSPLSIVSKSSYCELQLLPPDPAAEFLVPVKILVLSTHSDNLNRIG